MKAHNRIVQSAMLAMALAMGSPAAAQSPSGAPPIQPVTLTMEQRHVNKEIILKDLKVTPPAATAATPTRAGDVVPAGVPLQPIPVEVSVKVPQIKSHSFYVKDNAVVIVDPKDNKVMETVN
jgi:hypothetical protein